MARARRARAHPGRCSTRRTVLPGRSTTCSPTPSGRCRSQLEALSALHESDPSNAEELGEGLRLTKVLASEGLAEARRAVQTLREDVAPLEEQLGTLCARSGAAYSCRGRLDRSAPRRQSPSIVLRRSP